MTEEQIQNVLKTVVNKKYPEIDMDLYVSSERDGLYISSTGKKIYNILINLTPSDYQHYVIEGRDNHIWTGIKLLLRDTMRMLGIFDKIKLFTNNHE